jgi:O-antigen ligase
MWVLPFLSPRHQLPIPSFYGELTAFVLGMLAMCALWQKKVWADFQLPRITLLPFGILCIILLQMLLGMIVYPQMALIGMQYLLWACLLMVLGHRLRCVLGWEKLSITLAWFLVGGGLINTGMTILQYSGVTSLWLFPKLTAQSFGNLGQPNHFADYMALATGSLLYLWGKRRLPDISLALLATTFLAMLALSGSRSSWFYLSAFFILAFIRQRTDPSRENRQLMFACFMLLPAFAVIQASLLSLLPLLGNETHILPTERFFQQVNGASVRLTLWRDALQMLAAHPWLGVGYGQFAWNSFLLAGTHAANEVTHPAEHAHSLPLNLLAELGIFAGMLLATCGWLWIKAATKDGMSLERWWMWSLLAVLGIHSMLEYPLWYSYFLGIAAVLLGAGETRLLHPDFSRIGRPALSAMLALGLYSAIGLQQSYAALESCINRAITHKIRDSELASTNQNLLRLRKESMLAPYVELMYAMSLTPSNELLDEKLLISATAMHFEPVSEVVYRYAELLALKGEFVAAQKQITLAVQAYPEDFSQYQKSFQALGLMPAPQQKSPALP